MSGTIDERVVRMKFDNAQFGTGVSSTLKQLDQLKQALRLDGASKGLEQVSNSASRFSLAGMGQQISGIMSKFSALQIAAVAAFGIIAAKAVAAGAQLAKSFTIQPLIDGFREYETNLNSIQTILSNTGLKGEAGLKRVNNTLDQLNKYSDQTIYNFSEMARNIGTFTAAGVDLKTSASAIKGIANLAAISGSNSQQASTAMYQLSQSLAAGKVSLEDWNSVVNAGLGGKVFQNSLMETARAHGVAVDSIVKKSGSFRNSLQEGWITTEILTETLSKFTGELSREQLKSMGYTDQQIKGILEMGKTAVDAATKVKTITQLMDTLKEAMSSGWAKTFQILFGDFNEARELFTGINEVLGGVISRSADARNKVLQGWKDLGGRQALIDGIANAFQALLSFLRPIGQAFRDIFPKKTAQDLYDMTVSFRDFMERLKLGEETANNLRRTFAGFFAILGIGWELIKAGIGFIFDLVGAITGGSGGFLEFTGSIGDFLVSLHKAIKEGQLFTKFFDFLGKILSVPIKLLHLLGDLLGELFSGLDASDATGSVNELSGSLSILERIAAFVSQAWDKVVEVFHRFLENLGPIGQGIADWASNVGEAFARFFTDLNFENLLSAINTGLFATLVLVIKKFFGNFTEIFGDFMSGGGGLFGGVVDALDGLTGALEGMQNALNSTALLLIAAAIGILTLSLIALSKIDADGLKRASVAIAVMFVQLGLAFHAFASISTGFTAAKVGLMAAGLILLATAVRILASAVAKLAGIPTDNLYRGLIAVATLLTMLVVATRKMNTATGGMIRTAAGLVILAAALRLLVLSVKALGEMDWASLSKGLVGVGALLASLVLFTRFVAADKAGLTQGLGIILLAAGLKILASAVEDFTKFNWEQLARGMTGVAAGLGVMVLALNLLPTNTVFKAAGIVILATSLGLIADAVGQMSGLSWIEIAKGITTLAAALVSIAAALRLIPPGSVMNAAAVLIVATSLNMLQRALGQMAGMSWEEIARGLTVLAGSLILISAALRVTAGTISGSVAVTIMAAALNLLVPVLVALGAMSWGEIIKSLAGLAGVFIVLGAAAYVLAPVTSVLLALGAAIALLGVAVLAAGIGVLAFATALTVLAAAGAAGVGAIMALIMGLAKTIPAIMEGLARGIIAFATIIAQSGPQMTAALVTILDSLLTAIIRTTPKALRALEVMLIGLLGLLVRNIPRMVDAGLKLVIGLLDGLTRNMPKIVDKGVDLVIALLKGIARNAPKILKAGVEIVWELIKGIGQALWEIVKKGAELAWNFIKGVVQGILDGIKKVVQAAIDMAKNMVDGAMGVLKIKSPSRVGMFIGEMFSLGVAAGVVDSAGKAADASAKVGQTVVDAMSETLGGLGEILNADLIDFNPTIAPVLDLSAVRKDADEISRILALPPLDVTGTATSAANANAGFEENRTDGSDETGGGDTYNNYTQNNNSPKALSEAEIYRQTKNLLSRTKGGPSA